MLLGSGGASRAGVRSTRTSGLPPGPSKPESWRFARPKQPYLDWAANLDESGLVPSPTHDQTAYLIPSLKDDEEAERVLRTV